jgi:hypothetical protein
MIDGYEVLKDGVPKLTLIEPPGSLPRLFLRHKAQEESVVAKLTRLTGN